jgi:hypothetical protein
VRTAERGVEFRAVSAQRPACHAEAMTPGADREPTNRERDATGRPRNARPRDGLGRPLPRGAVGVPRVPDDLVLPPRQALDEAQRLLDAGQPFHAHEVLEAAWQAAPDDERALWQGLAQLTVGLTHLLRGNPAGAAALLRRGADRIIPYRSHPPHGVDVPGLLTWAAQAASQAVQDPGQVPTPIPRLCP